MLDRIRNLVGAAREAVASLDAARINGSVAIEAVQLFAELERLAVAGRTMAGRRVEETNAWFGSGYPTAAKWMAARAQTTVGAAIATLETGRRLERLPATREAFATGARSAQQAHDITQAASADPAAETSLLDAASKDSVNSLREQCQQVIAAASNDTDEDQRRHRKRYLRMKPEDGMIRVDGLLTMDGGAKLKGVVDARAQHLAEKALRTGVREGREAYAADALVALADATTSGPKAVVNVLIDYNALKRGHLEKGEKSTIPGIGPISVPAVKRLASEGVVKAILTEGAGVRAVANLGRTIPANLRSPLEARDETCVVPGCEATEDLEIHFFTDPLERPGRTRLSDVCRVCWGHALLINQRGWRIAGGPGKWRWLPPEHPGLPPPPNN